MIGRAMVFERKLMGAAWICQFLINSIGHGYIWLNKPAPVDLSQ